MKYSIRCEGRTVEISESGCSYLVFRIPYQNLADSSEELIEIKNKFIVYILFGENNNGPDVLYVGKSTKGLE